MGQHKDPAVRALREAHKDFARAVVARGDTPHTCYDSDLRHDERDCAKHPGQPFVWIIGAWSTHMVRFPDAIGCYVATRQDAMRLEVVKVIGYVLDAYRPRKISDDGIRAYVWDSAALCRATSTDDLWTHVRAVVRRRAESHLESLRPEAREELALARADQAEQRIARATERIAGLDRDLAIAKEWGNV